MKEEMKLVPKRRFQEFQNSDVWEQRELSSVGDFVRTTIEPRTSPNKLFVEYSMPSYDNGRIPETVFGESMQSMRLKISGDVLLINKLNVRQKRIWLVEDAPNDAVASSEFMPFTSTEIELAFLEQLMLSDKTTNELESISSGTSNSQKRITPSDVLQYQIKLPTDKIEQKKIGSFLKKLDNLITIEQRKLEKTKALKSAYLSELFPTKNECEPKRRFAGFTQPWEQRKLGEMSNSFEYGLNASATTFDGINKYIRITDIDDNSRLFNQSALTSPDVDVSNLDKYLLKKGDILFARTGASVGKTYRYQESDGKVYFAGFLIRARINPDFDSEFVFQNTLTQKYAQYIKITSQRSGQPGVNAQEYAQYNLMVPTLEEQKKIGSFFKNLDETIDFQQRKLEKLQNLKKAYLNEMFI